MADTSLFSRLKRLFSTDVVIRNVGGDQLKVVDIAHTQAAGKLATNSIIDRYSKLYTTSTAGSYNSNQTYQTLRVQLYRDYELMNTDAIIASALDLISEECTLKNEHDEVLQIRSSDDNIQRILYNLFYDVLNIEFNLSWWIRSMCLKGDFYLKLEILEEFGVTSVIPFSAEQMIREEGYDTENKKPYVKFILDPSGNTGGSNYVSYNASGKGIGFGNHEIAHFRLLSDANFLPYGRSYIEPARKVWHQYTMMKDAMLIHRIVRAPDKRIFYLNVGAIPPSEVDQFMQSTINKIKKTPYVDPQTGQYNLKYNLQNMLEDIYIPVRGNDTTTKIDKAPSLEYNGIEDVEFLKDELFAALRIPKSFFGTGDPNMEGKSTLAQQDIRFARTIEKIQRIIVSELYKIALIHLYVQGYDKENLTNFEIKLTTPSILYEQERMDLLQKKMDLATQAYENSLMPMDIIYKDIFHLSEEQIEEYRNLIIEDKKFKFRLDQIEHEGNDPQQTGESYGTPHDLASLYGQGRYSSNSKEVPDGYDENELGRPKEKNSVYGTQASSFSKDPMGTEGNKKIDGVNSRSLEEAKSNYARYKNVLTELPKKKKLIFEKKEPELNFLDESNIKDYKN